MLFNSFEFFLFFSFFYSLYLVLKHRQQNWLLLVASYVFYGAWDWRFLSLIIISTVLDYFCGIKIHETTELKKRRFFLFLSVAGNLSILGFFKYFNFFLHDLISLFNLFGLSVQPLTLKIILPLGISFYTFQTMSYTIDIYRKEISPTRSFFDLALFVAFFPQLVAGPIMRARDLLPQIVASRKIKMESVYEGCYLIFWGLFEKVFVADNLAKIVNPVFSTPPYEGGRVLMALYAFAFQIFCDFDGYSNIARGLGKCMGFEIVVNFRLPYFSTNPREFWQRWHISLSSWLRDYLYIPLGGNKSGEARMYGALLITMLLGGLWHGAAWTFVIWGLYQGVLLISHRLIIGRSKREQGKVRSHSATKVLKIIIFFHLTLLGWLLFRAQSLPQVGQMLQALFFNFRVHNQDASLWLKLLGFSLPLFAVQFWQYKSNDLMIIYKQNKFLKTVLYAFMAYLLIGWGALTAEEFIYFQF